MDKYDERSQIAGAISFLIAGFILGVWAENQLNPEPAFTLIAMGTLVGFIASLPFWNSGNKR